MDIENQLKEIQDRKDLSSVEKLSAIESLKGLLKESNNKTNNRRKMYMLKSSDKERFLQLVNTNFSNDDLFVSVTHWEDDISIDKASLDFENWIKRMRDRYGDFNYIGVRFFNKKGGISFHLIMNIPGIPEGELRRNYLRKLWGHGNVHIEKVNFGSSLSELSRYFIWRLHKFVEDKRYAGKSLFLKSENLVEPTKNSYKECFKKLNHKGTKVNITGR